MTNSTPPNLDQPIINEPEQAIPPAPSGALGSLEHLVGTWTNQNIHNSDKGDMASPCSY